MKPFVFKYASGMYKGFWGSWCYQCGMDRAYVTWAAALMGAHVHRLVAHP